MVSRVLLSNLVWIALLERYPEDTQIRCDTPFPTQPLSGPVLCYTARLSQRYPPIARYGVFGVSTWPIGCDTPAPFSERFSPGEHAKWRCDTPHLKRGISAILARDPMKTRQMGAVPPSAILSPKGIASDMGGYLALTKFASDCKCDGVVHSVLTGSLRLLNALNSEDRGLKVRFPLR